MISKADSTTSKAHLIQILVAPSSDGGGTRLESFQEVAAITTDSFSVIDV
jgi:hypothetical protein